MNDVEIRPCRDDDLPGVRELLLQLAEFAHVGSGLDELRIRELFAEMEPIPMYLNLVAVDDGQVTGFVSVLFYKSLFHRGGTALINELVVSRAARGRGIGRRLIEWVVAEARTRGLDEIEVGTERDNQAAQRFYHRCGFDEEYVLLGMEFD